MEDAPAQDPNDSDDRVENPDEDMLEEQCQENARPDKRLRSRSASSSPRRGSRSRIVASMTTNNDADSPDETGNRTAGRTTWSDPIEDYWTDEHSPAVHKAEHRGDKEQQDWTARGTSREDLDIAEKALAATYVNSSFEHRDINTKTGKMDNLVSNIVGAAVFQDPHQHGCIQRRLIAQAQMGVHDY